MNKLISCCGLDCNACDARIATIADDNDLREKVAEKWRVQYNATGITADMINCTGCTETGAKFSHCSQCQIRKCALSNNYKTCAECKKMETCDIVKSVYQYVPEALANLKSIRN